MNKPTAEEQQEKKVAIKIAEKIISIPDNEHLYMSVGAKNAHTLIAPMAYTCCWQGVWSDVVRWEAEQLALVRLAVWWVSSVGGRARPRGGATIQRRHIVANVSSVYDV